MPVSPTTNPTAQIISSAAAGYIKKTTGSSNAPAGSSSAMQEAMETAETTRKEAAHGDWQAKAKLAKEQQQAQQNAPAQEPGKGNLLDQKA